MKRKLLIGIGSILTIFIISYVSIYFISESRLNHTYMVPTTEFSVPVDSATVKRGQYLFLTRGCADCHGENLAGRRVLEDSSIAVITGSNLTTGKNGIAKYYRPDTWARAIRHGIAYDGRPLMLMPSSEYAHLGDDDTRKMIAYIQSAPAVDSSPAINKPGPLGRILFVFGAIPVLHAELINHSAKRAAAPPPGITVSYGEYLAKGCTGCHGEHFSGGKIPGTPPDWPPATNITPDPKTGIGKWTEADFIRSLRTGKRPDGSDINPLMPWKYAGQMTDSEIKAMWLYLSSLAPKSYGGR